MKQVEKWKQQFQGVDTEFIHQDTPLLHLSQCGTNAWEALAKQDLSVCLNQFHLIISFEMMNSEKLF